MVSSIQEIKNTGATFTPLDLADFLSERILANYKGTITNLKILDPACGEGILLSSIAKKLKNKNKHFELFGCDINQSYLQKSKFLLQSQGLNVDLKQTDFLDNFTIEQTQMSLFETKKNNNLNSTIDLVIANPPYVRTQILGTDYAQKIAKKFKLKGRVDLYYPFLIGMTQALKENGIIGVITSNRYLSTKSGKSIRQFLEENYNILEVIDLGDTKLFDAAVLPAIFIGQKKSKKTNNLPRFTKIYEAEISENCESEKALNIYDILKNKNDGHFKLDQKTYKKTSGFIQFQDSEWNFLTSAEAEWIAKINRAAHCKIGDLFNVKIGIKTTADKVFIKDNWDEIAPQPEAILLKKLISQENIETWQPSQNIKLKVLYPHIIKKNKRTVIDLEDYPNAKKYLESFEKRLKSRKYLIDAGRKWYEIWVPHNPNHWQLPKIVFPDISTHPRFFLDENGHVVNGNCYWIVAKNETEKEWLYLIQGIANSRLMTKYHDLMFNNKLYSGRRRYFSQYVEKYPLPNLTSQKAQNIISLVKQIHKTEDEKQQILIEQLEIEVANAFGVNPIL